MWPKTTKKWAGANILRVYSNILYHPDCAIHNTLFLLQMRTTAAPLTFTVIKTLEMELLAQCSKENIEAAPVLLKC